MPDNPAFPAETPRQDTVNDEPSLEMKPFVHVTSTVSPVVIAIAVALLLATESGSHATASHESKLAQDEDPPTPSQVTVKLVPDVEV
jgi:hypothetical protein